MNLFFSKKKQQAQGFTLLELLIVVAIITVFAAITIFVIDTARTKSRNSARLTDIKTLQNGFYLGYDSNGGLPSSGTWSCVSRSCYDAWSIYGVNMSVSGFMNYYKIKTPSDPRGGSRGYGGYLYHSAWSGGTGYDGSTFSAGAVFNYRVEPPLNSDSCGAGRIYAVTDNYIDCITYVLP